MRAPSLAGIYNNPVAIVNEAGQTVTIKADARYIHDSIVLPEKEIAAGYQPLMPSYKGRVSEEELVQLVEYIKSLAVTNGTSNGSARSYDAAGVTTKVDGATPEVGTMAKSTGRERTLAKNDQYTGGTDVSGMDKSTQREATFNGTGNRAATTGTTDDAAGGMRPYVAERGGPKVYTTPGYTKSAARVYSGGHTATDHAYKIKPPTSSAEPSVPTNIDASSNREQERTGQ